MSEGQPGAIRPAALLLVACGAAMAAQATARETVDRDGDGLLIQRQRASLMRQV